MSAITNNLNSTNNNLNAPTPSTTASASTKVYTKQDLIESACVIDELARDYLEKANNLSNEISTQTIMARESANTLLQIKCGIITAISKQPFQVQNVEENANFITEEYNKCTQTVEAIEDLTLKTRILSQLECVKSCETTLAKAKNDIDVATNLQKKFQTIANTMHLVHHLNKEKYTLLITSGLTSFSMPCNHTTSAANPLPVSSTSSSSSTLTTQNPSLLMPPKTLPPTLPVNSGTSSSSSSSSSSIPPVPPPNIDANSTFKSTHPNKPSHQPTTLLTPRTNITHTNLLPPSSASSSSSTLTTQNPSLLMPPKTLPPTLPVNSGTSSSSSSSSPSSAITSSTLTSSSSSTLPPYNPLINATPAINVTDISSLSLTPKVQSGSPSSAATFRRPDSHTNNKPTTSSSSSSNSSATTKTSKGKKPLKRTKK